METIEVYDKLKLIGFVFGDVTWVKLVYNGDIRKDPTIARTQLDISTVGYNTKWYNDYHICMHSIGPACLLRFFSKNGPKWPTHEGRRALAAPTQDSASFSLR